MINRHTEPNPVHEVAKKAIDASLVAAGESTGAWGGPVFAIALGALLMLFGPLVASSWSPLRGVVMFFGGAACVLIGLTKAVGLVRLRPRKKREAFIEEIRRATRPARVCLTCRTVLESVADNWCPVCRKPSELFTVGSDTDLALVHAAMKR